MLRFFVLALLLFNGAYFAWSGGLLRSWGLAPVQQNEPQRLTQQIRPETMRLLSPDEARRAEAVKVAARPAECLQAGLLNASQQSALRALLEPTWPAGSWSLSEVLEPGRWIVYMGKYPNDAALKKKRGELAALKLKFEPLENPALEPGLSLGAFDNKTAATQALDGVSRKGVRTARVVQERAELQGALLRLPAVDEVLRSRLDELRPVLGDAALVSCR